MSEIKTGGISVETEHIFPIIKKWLYSEKDIFLREIVSNASDAITKLKRLQSLGETDIEDTDYRIDVILDKESKTLTVKDNGIGLTEDELKKYICSIALSGALDFISKYESNDNGNAAQSGIIGHFGLGFYSSFMVSDKVEIDTKSYTGADAVHWVCDEKGDYEISSSDRTERGTSVIMHISDDEAEYLESSKISAILAKYCAFMPIEIYYTDVSSDEDTDETEEKNGDAKPQKEPINDTNPLWLKNPSDCKPEEYTEFYRKVFMDFREPLFYIHINADYPLNFKGILFFPKLANEYESIEGQVKLYYNQVFVADNIKEVIPEYLLMLKGVLDCPELPLNVSRSYLQNNSYVSKVSAHIVKKVTDKLNSLCTTDRQKYESVWSDIKTFVEYACMRDRKFYDRVKNSLLLEMTDGTYKTTAEYLESAKEKHENIIYYASDKDLQSQYLKLFADQGIEVAVLDSPIDVQFVSVYESYESNIKYVRIDADIAGALKDEGEVEKNEAIISLFREVSGNEKLEVEFAALKSSTVPAILTVSEESRRMDEMMKMYSRAGMNLGMQSMPVDSKLTVNTASPITEKLSELVCSDSDKAKAMASYIYKLSLLSQRKLNSEEMQSFLQESFNILEKF